MAGRYLAGRGCAIPSPGADLRWLPAHRHPYGYVGPVLLALLTDAVTNGPRTVHRTWLAQEGSAETAIEKLRLQWKGLSKTGAFCRLVSDAGKLRRWRDAWRRNAGTPYADQLMAYLEGIRQEAIERQFEFRHAVEVLAVFDTEAGERLTRERLATQPDFAPFAELFYFKALAQVQAIFRHG